MADVDVDVAVVGDHDAALKVAALALAVGRQVAVVSERHEVRTPREGLTELQGRVLNTEMRDGRTLVTLDTGVRLGTAVLVPASILDPDLYCTL